MKNIEELVNELDAEKLLLRVNSGKKLEPEELQGVLQLLDAFLIQGPGKALSIDDVYNYLLLIGRAKAKEYTRVLESFLEIHDPLTVSLILEILCLEWNRTPDYLERVTHFAVGASWDTENDVRETAIKILGEHVRKHLKKLAPGTPLSMHDSRVLELLLNICEDSDDDLWTRKIAYTTLLHAYGKPDEELPPEHKWLNFDKGSADIDWATLAALRQLVESSSSDDSDSEENEESESVG